MWAVKDMLRPHLAPARAAVAPQPKPVTPSLPGPELTALLPPPIIPAVQAAVINAATSVSTPTTAQQQQPRRLATPPLKDVTALLARNPAAYELLTRTDDDKEVCEVAIYNQRYLEQPLRQIEFPGDLLILAIRREGELVVPNGDTRLSAGDQITLVGSCSCMEITREMAGAVAV